MATAAGTPPSPSISNKSGQDNLSDGVMSLLRPSIENLDDKVYKVKMSQAELTSSIDIVGNQLRGIADNMPNSRELDPHIKRLSNARRKVNIINSILNNCQDRLRKLHTQIGRETYRREQSMQKNLTTTPHSHATSSQQSSIPQLQTAAPQIQSTTPQNQEQKDQLQTEQQKEPQDAVLQSPVQQNNSDSAEEMPLSSKADDNEIVTVENDEQQPDEAINDESK